jgi:hypothetical protein
VILLLLDQKREMMEMQYQGTGEVLHELLRTDLLVQHLDLRERRLEEILLLLEQRLATMETLHPEMDEVLYAQ